MLFFCTTEPKKTTQVLKFDPFQNLSFCSIHIIYRKIVRSFITKKNFFSTGGTQIFDTEVHCVTGARLPVQGRQLSTSQLSTYETSGGSHKNVQKKNERWLSDLQAACGPVLSPREALSGGEMSCTFLLQHQAQAETAATTPEVTAGSTSQETYGCYEQHATVGVTDQHDQYCLQQSFYGWCAHEARHEPRWHGTHSSSSSRNGHETRRTNATGKCVASC